MTPIDEIVKEFEKFDISGALIVYEEGEQENYPRYLGKVYTDELFAKLHTALEQYGVHCTLDGYEQGRSQAIRSTREADIAAVERLDNPYPKDIFSPPWQGWQKDVDELAQKHGKRIDNISADYGRRYFELGKRQALAALKYLNEK